MYLLWSDGKSLEGQLFVRRVPDQSSRNKESRDARSYMALGLSAIQKSNVLAERVVFWFTIWIQTSSTLTRTGSRPLQGLYFSLSFFFYRFHLLKLSTEVLFQNTGSSCIYYKRTLDFCLYLFQNYLYFKTVLQRKHTRS